jgi:membrane-associated PAP2 superfamily phosphatase
LFLIPIILSGFEFFNLDIWVQTHFYLGHQTWVIDVDEPVLRFFFYDLPKTLILIFGVGLLLLFILSFRVKRFSHFKQKKYLYIILCVAIIPALIALLKKTTGIFCPYQTDIFGGIQSHVGLLSANIPAGYGRCFPAGHASGGFALMGLIFMAETRQKRLLYTILSIGTGIFMSGYQMMNGRHFLSHGLVTFLVAWAVCCLLYLILFNKDVRYEK